MGAPSIYVYDCSNAGIIVNSFNTFAEQHEREFEKNALAAGSRKSPSLSGGASGSNMNAIGDGGIPINHAISYKNCIQLAACTANQILPMNPQLPADLFTACLTTPIKIALKWFMLQQTASLVPHVSYDLIERYTKRFIIIFILFY
jgi:regulatory associated protein of mTOR